ncbi:hypothetical protein CEQ90_06580 [Lewinellaceae bacterium SD302]|nr:hypothetical protein CEQ90_06580 [Lewinellaceae bacterium SD302]
MTRLIRSLFLAIFSLACVGSPVDLSAHAPDQSYIYLRVYQNSLGGRFELAPSYLNAALGLGVPEEIEMDDLRPHLPRIYDYLRQRTGLGTEGGNYYELEFLEPEILDLDAEESEDFIKFNFRTKDQNLDLPQILEIKYNVMFDIEPKHRGLLIIEHNWELGINETSSRFANIFEPDYTVQTYDMSDGSVWNGFWALIKLGVWHIWIGLDHILFIIALILPAVVRRNRNKPFGTLGINQWEPVNDFKSAFLYLIKVITYFTIAHSITLALASLEIFTPPSYLVEAIIAFSIGLAAFHNIYPIFRQKEWLIAFVFGLFHGFGFASVLGEKGLGGDYLIYSLLGFNIGVEVGQLLIICAAFPLIYLIRGTKFYRYFILIGSFLLIWIALHWTIERGFDVDIRLVSTVRNLLGI